MASAVDSGDAEAVAMGGQAQSLDARFEAKTAFAEPELLGMVPRGPREKAPVGASVARPHALDPDRADHASEIQTP